MQGYRFKFKINLPTYPNFIRSTVTDFFKTLPGQLSSR
jgi:hypothetical protein